VQDPKRWPCRRLRYGWPRTGGAICRAPGRSQSPRRLPRTGQGLYASSALVPSLIVRLAVIARATYSPSTVIASHASPDQVSRKQMLGGPGMNTATQPEPPPGTVTTT
jgi:hypothetical protein